MPHRGAQALIRERTRLAVLNRRVFPYLALVTLNSGEEIPAASSRRLRSFQAGWVLR